MSNFYSSYQNQKDVIDKAIDDAIAYSISKMNPSDVNSLFSFASKKKQDSKDYCN